MAERTVLTNIFFGNVGRLLAGSAGSAYAYIGADAAAMSGLTAASTALASECAANGFERASAATVDAYTTSVTNDTLRVLHQFTCATATQTIHGCGVFIGATGSTLGVFHEWAASVAFEVGDKVTETIQVQAKAD